MIIGINGKIGSGKDTIGSIIQFLICAHKMTLADYQAKTLEFFILASISNEIQSGWEIKKFAGKLKQIASLLTGVDVEKFEDQEFKKQIMNNEWNYFPADLEKHGVGEKYMTYREFLQKLGTEAMRDGLHTNVWVNALFADYKTEESWLNVQLSEKPELVYPNWIITDMRFPNEMEAVVERKGITIRVIREFYEFSNDQHEWSDREDREGNVFIANSNIYSKEESNKEWRNALKERTHASETALDDAEFDYEIINDGSIEELIEKVKEILIKENII